MKLYNFLNLIVEIIPFLVVGFLKVGSSLLMFYDHRVYKVRGLDLKLVF